MRGFMNNKEFFQICKDEFLLKYNKDKEAFKNEGYTLSFKFKGFVDETENKTFPKDSFVSESRLYFPLLYLFLKTFDRFIFKSLKIKRTIKVDSFWVLVEIYPVDCNYSKAFGENKIISFCALLGETRRYSNGELFVKQKKDVIFYLWLKTKKFLSSHMPKEKFFCRKLSRIIVKIFFYNRWEIMKGKTNL